MTKRKMICDSIMKLSGHDICNIEKSIVVSARNFVVIRTNNVISVDFEFYYYNKKVATLSLMSIPSKKWMLHLNKNGLWSLETTPVLTFIQKTG